MYEACFAVFQVTHVLFDDASDSGSVFSPPPHHVLPPAYPAHSDSNSSEVSSDELSRLDYNLFENSDKSRPRRRRYRPNMSTRDMPRGSSSRHRRLSAPSGGDRKFLKTVQAELEDQRHMWEGEVEHLMSPPSVATSRSSSKAAPASPGSEPSSYVDTSSGRPLFRAFVDVSDIPPRSLSVNVDALTNKVVVSSVQGGGSNVTKTFTQRIALPRFADTERVTSAVSRRGILKVEVPLMYWFPQPEEARQRDRQPKAFIYQVEEGRRGRQDLEILVNTGSEFRPRDIRVLLQDPGKLLIVGEKEVTDPRTGARRTKQKLIKQYSLPEGADTDRINSHVGRDGRVEVSVPLKHK